jgi:hypothetical protein
MLTGSLAAAMGGLTCTDSASAQTPAKGKQVVFQQEIPVRYDVDVFVAGGGPAGVAAAFAAAQQGAKVYLAESHTCLGGMGTAARVPLFMQTTDGVNFLPGGFGRAVVTRLKEQSRLRGPANDTEALKCIYDEMLSEVNVQFTFYTTLIAVEATAGLVSHVVCAAPSGMFAVRAKTYIDATGNGDLAVGAGADFKKGDAQGNLMPGTLCSVWAGVDWDRWTESRPKRPQPQGYMLEKAFADGVFTVHDEHLTGMFRLGEHGGVGNIGHTFGVDANDERSLTKALVEGRKGLAEYLRYYREYLPGFEKLELIGSGSLLGVRETRRISGDYVLSLDDYMKRAVFSDEIGRYAYPIDNHPTRPGKDTYEQHRREFDKDMKYKKGETYGIPYRSLIPKKLKNVLVAGRCISADRLVHGSIRVMPGCFITGQAAGVAAAMSVGSACTPRQIDVAKLQQRLKTVGAFLPNC